MTAPPPLPLPPACNEVDLDAIDGAEYFGAPAGYRLHRVGRRPAPRGSHPLTYVRVGSAPSSRWDPPYPLTRGGSRYGVWYGSTTDIGAMLEVFFREDETWVAHADRAGRVIGQVEVVRPLRLLDLHSPAVGRIYPTNRLDESICTIRMYSLTTAWSELFHECDPAIDGLIYRSRKAGVRGVNVAIFGRATDALVAVDTGIAVDDPSLSSLRGRFVDLTGMAWPLT